MLFNSSEFIFFFLPGAVLLHFVLARWSVNAAVAATTLSSLFFYAWWNPPFLVLPIVSILVNYWLARRIVAAEQALARSLLIVGICANLALLCYFKYADFLLSIIDGHKAVPPNVPLALSFTTFVQIAFLVHVYQRRASFDFSRYALFVAFFPHLIAGPIVRWSSLGNQIGDPSRYRVDWNNVALGLTIFTLGLAKKVLIADPLSPHVAAVFDAAARGDPVTALAAWAGCFAFAVQIYFDFSGYSDMAIGIGLLFNFRLPINFAAPLRAASILDLWRRWHVTLSRLARDLIYVPIALGRGESWRMAGLMITMIVIGVWHGAGWTFVAWGAYNGILLQLNTIWRDWRGGTRPTRSGQLVGWALTITAFAAGMAFFRAADIETSWRLLAAMSGFGPPAADEGLALTWDDWLIRSGYVTEPFILTWFGTTWSMVGTLWTLTALAIALLVPDTMEITGYREADAQSDWRRPIGVLAWRLSPVALGATIVVLVAALANVGRVSEFLYYQF
jgi:D-alanyl-lipoteichoic acid acyltransferase DltB (MBOAT superfamily)